MTDAQWNVRTVGRDAIPEFTRITDTVDVPWSGAQNVHFERATADEIDFTATHFWAFSTSGSKFSRCSFRQATFEGGGLGGGRQSIYVDCTFDEADLTNIDLGNVRFEGCSFRRAAIRDWAADAAEFIDCIFAGPIQDSRFCGRPVGIWGATGTATLKRSRNAFSGNDFASAQLIGCEFIYGIDLSAQRWPDGPEYVRLDRWPERVGLARHLVAEWPPAARRDAEAILNIYSRDGYDEQDEIFADKYNLGFDRGVVDRTWGTLASVLQ